MSKEYGWLPSQIRKENYEDISDYLDILSNKAMIEKAEQKKQSRH